MEQLATEVQFLEGDRDFSHKHNDQNISGLIHPSIQLLLEAVSLEIRWVGHETTTSSYVFMVCCFVIVHNIFFFLKEKSYPLCVQN